MAAQNSGGFYHIGEKLDFAFYRIPKLLFTDERYKKLSADAKLLYAILFDRMTLSAQNGFTDDNGRIYLYFTITQMCELLNFGRGKVGKLYHELEQNGLIYRQNQGNNKAAIIYPKKLAELYALKSNVPMLENRTSGRSKIERPGARKSGGNNTEYNNTEYSNTDLSISGMDWEAALALAKEQIEYDIICKRKEYIRLDEIVNIITEVMCLRSPTVQIGKQIYPTSYVQYRFSQLDSLHIEYIHDRLRETKTPIKDIKSYLLSALFNAPATMGHYYEAAVRSEYSGL